MYKVDLDDLECQIESIKFRDKYIFDAPELRFFKVKTYKS